MADTSTRVGDALLATQAADLPTLHERMNAVLLAELQYTKEHCGGAFMGIGRAPDYFHALWNDAMKLSPVNDTAVPFEMSIAA